MGCATSMLSMITMIPYDAAYAGSRTNMYSHAS
jgi:hypothetical protein